MIRKRSFICIVCPNGCVIEAHLDDGRLLAVSGNKCKRGEEYVLQEVTDPRRTIASSVPISGAVLPLCSVRVTRPIPKREIFHVMQQINRVRLTAPVHIGQIVLHDVCGLESDVIVTKEMECIEGSR